MNQREFLDRWQEDFGRAEKERFKQEETKMSDREELPGDPSLPPGVSQRDIDNATEGELQRCYFCGRLINDGVVCSHCDDLVEGE